MSPYSKHVEKYGTFAEYFCPANHVCEREGILLVLIIRGFYGAAEWPGTDLPYNPVRQKYEKGLICKAFAEVLIQIGFFRTIFGTGVSRDEVFIT